MTRRWKVTRSPDYPSTWSFGIGRSKWHYPPSVSKTLYALHLGWFNFMLEINHL